MAELSELTNHPELTREQISAIKSSIELGRRLQEEHPEIENLYRSQKFSLTN